MTFQCVPSKPASTSSTPSSTQSWHFISARPKSELENRRNKAVVRAYASRSRRRNRKPEKDLRETENERGVASSGEDSHVSEIVTSRSTSRTSSVRVVSPFRSMSAASSISFDPFETYPSNLPRDLIDKLIPDVLSQTTILLPPLGPQDNNERYGAYTTTWIRTAMHDSAVFHTALFAALYNARIPLGANSARTRNEILCYQIALEEMTQKLADSKLATSEEAIQTVCCLAFHMDDVVHVLGKSPRQGPFGGTQMLDLYGGSISYCDPHIQGLFAMLRARGGLEDLKLEGMSELACYVDIICANREIKRPVFPFFARIEDPAGHLRRLAETLRTLSPLSTGFIQLKEMMEPDRGLLVRKVLSWMCDYTLILDSFTYKDSKLITLGMLADLRNFVQHSLLSLSPIYHDDNVSPLFEMCYSAAMVYSWIVIFPVPLHAVPMHACAAKIRRLLDTEEVEKLWTQVPFLMLWCVFMGAMASLGSVDEQGYVRFLARALPRLKINSWAELKDRLQRYLWYSSASDLDGVDLYQEILHFKDLS